MTVPPIIKELKMVDLHCEKSMTISLHFLAISLMLQWNENLFMSEATIGKQLGEFRGMSSITVATSTYFNLILHSSASLLTNTANSKGAKWVP